MIKVHELQIDKKEVLRYLGHNMQVIDDNLNSLIDDTIEESKKLFAPKYVYGEYKIIVGPSSVMLEGTSLLLKGTDIKEHLKNSESVVIMAVTLGTFIEKQISLYERINLTKALILDACATTAVEEVCDIIENYIKEMALKRNLGITSRYSPGYGDLPLSTQEEFINTLGAEKRIGLSTSKEFILFPRKSVTAIIGIVPKKFESKKRTCEVCKNYNNCSYRRKGTNCGN